MKTKRPKKQLTRVGFDNGKVQIMPALATAAAISVFTADHSRPKQRDDAGLIAAAQAKRERKAARRAGK